MNQLLPFLAGLALGLLIASVLVQRLNDRWYRLARNQGVETAKATAAALRYIADWIPDPDMSAAVKRGADQLEEAWR